jgi:crotonobetainyl-CoA:carnitine CoA-transferase CaiB-like acyl-CoA transferase
VGDTTQLGVPIFLQGTPGAVKGPQPTPGADTAAVLGSLGHDSSELDKLRAQEVI